MTPVNQQANIGTTSSSFISNLFGEGLNQIKQTASSYVMNAVQQGINSLSDTVSKTMNLVAKLFKCIVNNITSYINQGITEIKSTYNYIVGTFNSTLDTISKAMEAAAEVFHSQSD